MEAEIKRTPFFTKENAREMQQKGLAVRMETNSPERRRYLARRAVMRRWYRINGDPLDRVISAQRVLALMVADAMLVEDHDKVVSRVCNMLGYERLRIALETGAMKDVTPEFAAETTDKILEARQKRERILGMRDAEGSA